MDCCFFATDHAAMKLVNRSGGGIMETKEVLDLAEEVTKWIASPEGKQTLSKTVQLTEQATDQLESSRRIDEQSLNDPFTV